MKRLIFALSLAVLVGLFALSGFTAPAYAYNISGDQAQITAHGPYTTVEWHHYHHWRGDRDDYDGPYVRDYNYYNPYYYPYPYGYNYGPGFSISTPFFGFYFP